MHVQASAGLSKARAKQARIQLEQQCIRDMDAAIKTNTMASLNAAVAKARELGLTDVPQFATIEKLLSKFAAEVCVTQYDHVLCVYAGE